jgi:hypothetical protein
MPACSAGPRSARGLGKHEPDPDSAMQVQFNDDLEGILKVGTVVTRRTETGTLLVQVPIINLTERSQWLLVQIVFRDRDGIEVDTGPRERIEVPRESTHTWARSSLRSEVTSFTVRLWKDPRKPS